MAVFTKGIFKSSSGGSGGGLTPEVQEALDTKANKATSLAGYGITDAYTKTQSDGKYATTAQGAKADTAVQPAAISDMLTKTEAGTTYAKTTELSTVAKTGSYNDLTDKPVSYTLPIASDTTLGGVKVDGETISIDAEGVISTVSSTTSSPNAVTIDTEQTITASKTFDADIILKNNVHGIKSKASGNLLGTWNGWGFQLGNTGLDTTVFSTSIPKVECSSGKTYNMSLLITVTNKENLPEASSYKGIFGFLTETSTLVFCDGTAWKQITLTDLA